MYGQWPAAKPMFALTLLAFTILAVGFVIFGRAQNRFVEEL